MDLLLWRHAEAEDGFPDSERKLTSRGEEQVRRMAAWLKAHVPANLRIIASPAKRCQQTAQALGRPFETDSRLGTGSVVADLLAVVDWPDNDSKENNATLLVGHQPTLGQTAAHLLSGNEADWPIKKGAVWWLVLGTRQKKIQTSLKAAIGPELI